MTEINTANYHLVGANQGGVIISLPPLTPMPPKEALRMAAWIVACAEVIDPNSDTDAFLAVLAAVRST